jgi:hypothetical protein
MIMSAAASGATRPGAFALFRGCLVPLDPDALLPGRLAAGLAGVSIQVIVVWRNRGYLPVATDDAGRELRGPRGRPLYRVRDVLAVEARTAERCESMARRPAVRAPLGIGASGVDPRLLRKPPPLAA